MKNTAAFSALLFSAAYVGAASLSVLQVDPYSHEVYTGHNRPSSGVETKVIKSAAALGEIESASFTITPDKDLSGFLLTAGDLTSDGGATLPASAIDIAVVKAMFNPDAAWFSTWRGNQSKPVLYNDLIVHDDDLLVVDEEKQINFLRVDYPAPIGPKYLDMRSPGRISDFNYERQPVRDAAKMVPMKRLRAACYQQFWLTYRVPADQKPGLYKGKVKVADSTGQIGEIGLELRVYPFSLPEPRTHYDTAKPFTMSFYGSPDLDILRKLSKNQAESETVLLNIYRNMAEHNVASLLGPSFKADSDDDIGVRSLILARQAGIRMRPTMASSGNSYTGEAAPAGRPKPDFDKEPELLKKTLKDHREAVEMGINIYDRILGHHDGRYFSPDECGSGTYYHISPFIDYLHSRGLKVYGDYANPHDTAWLLDMDCIAARMSHTFSWQWHAAGCETSSYAGPFFGCLCPDTWRRQKGLRLYMADHDGLTEYSFEFGANRWNKFAYRDSAYSQFGIVYREQDGILNTCAWEALREGVDDIRYYSLLRLRAEEAMKSADPAVKALGRENIVWFDSQDPEQIFDLNAFRAEVADRIARLIEKVGPETSVLPQSKPAPELPESSAAKAAQAFNATAGDPMAAVQRFENADQWDTALAISGKIRADASLDADVRCAAAVKEAKYLTYFGRRAEAAKMLSDFAEERGLPRNVVGKLKFAEVRTLLTDVVFEERYSLEQIEAARAPLDQALLVSGIPAETRGAAVVNYAEAACNAGHYQLCLDFLEPYYNDKAFSRFAPQLRLWRARGFRGIGELKKAISEYKIVIWEHGYDVFNLYREVGEVAEKAEDYKTALQAYTDWFPMIDKEEAKSLWNFCKNAAARCSAKVQKTEVRAIDAEGGLEMEDAGTMLDLDE